MEHSSTSFSESSLDSDARRGAVEILRAFEQVESKLAVQLVAAKKLRDAFAKTRKALSDKSRPLSALNSLITDLQKVSGDLQPPDTTQLILRIKTLLGQLKDGVEEDFVETLRKEAETAGLMFKKATDGFIFGPFLIIVNWSTERVALRYAKADLDKGLPLDAQAVTTRVDEHRRVLLLPPARLDAVAEDLGEAIRVAVARQKRVDHGLRAELPAVYREMALIREGTNARNAKAAAYSLPRFVVEVKSLIESDRNISGGHQFRLEAAVIENTGNTKKSVFFPNDIANGSGEGRYYQAITLVD